MMARPIRVLHVDDDPELVELTATFLEREDDCITVETAESASEGLELLAETPVDCIISDYDMPEQDGIAFLEAVRERAPDLPFILYTGKGSEEVASDAISAGVTDYLQKGRGTSQYTVLANRVKNAVEQFQSKRDLEASRKRLALFFDQSPLGVIEWNEEFEVVRINDAAEDILGYCEADLVGESWERIVPEEDRAAVDEVVDNLLEGKGGYHSVNENVRQNGERIVCEWHNRVVTDDTDEVIAIFSQFQDITERREQQKELERNRAAIQSVSNTIITVNESDVIQSVNPAVEEMFGYAPDELLGEPLTVLMSEPVAERHRRAFEQYLETGEKTLDWDHIELEGQHRDGSTVPLSVTYGEVTYDDERFFVGVLRDITERKQREEELQRTNAVLSTLFETLPVGVLAEDSAREILAVNQRLAALFDVDGDPDDLIGADCERTAHDLGEQFAHPEAFVERIGEIVADREPVTNEKLLLADGRTFERSYRPIALPEGKGHLWVYDDVTARTRYHERMQELQYRTKELIASHNPVDIATVAIDLAEETLDFPLSGIHLVDESGERLEPVATTAALRNHFGEAPVYDRVDPSRSADRFNWEVFERGDPVLVDDTETAEGISADESPSRSGVIYPLGDHGLFITSSPEPNAFDENDVHLVELLGTIVTAMLDRIEGNFETRH